MPKIKDIIINDLIKTNMGGIRTQNPILSKESIDEGTLNETIGLDSANKPVRDSTGSLSGTSLKWGIYIYNQETDKFEWVEEIPEGYTGIAYYFGDDYFSIQKYNDGVYVTETEIHGDEINTNLLSTNNLNFAHLTHSFNELDPTLKALCESAVHAGINGVACSEAQWNVIKSLLDKSLYFYYEVSTMIKVYTDGIDVYIFGNLNKIVGVELSFDYHNDEEKLYIYLQEI